MPQNVSWMWLIYITKEKQQQMIIKNYRFVSEGGSGWCASVNRVFKFNLQDKDTTKHTITITITISLIS